LAGKGIKVVIGPQSSAEIVLDLIEEFKPDIVFVNNDKALKYVGVEYTKRHPEKELPFVFSGINLDATIYDPIESLEMPGGSITWALERVPYYEAFFGVRESPLTLRKLYSWLISVPALPF
jgi:hypothetical protein